jgi:hypothetical protein
MTGSILGGPIVSSSRDKVVDIESQLFGINRIYSKCPTHQYIPTNQTYNTQNGAPGDNQIQNNQLKSCYFINQPKPTNSGIHIKYPTCDELKVISQNKF